MIALWQLMWPCVFVVTLVQCTIRINKLWGQNRFFMYSIDLNLNICVIRALVGCCVFQNELDSLW